MVRADIQILRQVQVNRLNVVIYAALLWYRPIALAISSVLVDDAVDVDDFEELGAEPVLNLVYVLSICMGQNHGVLGVSIDVQHLEFVSTLTVQVEMLGVHGEA